MFRYLQEAYKSLPDWVGLWMANCNLLLPYTAGLCRLERTFRALYYQTCNQSSPGTFGNVSMSASLRIMSCPAHSVCTIFVLCSVQNLACKKLLTVERQCVIQNPCEALVATSLQIGLRLDALFFYITHWQPCLAGEMVIHNHLFWLQRMHINLPEGVQKVHMVHTIAMFDLKIIQQSRVWTPDSLDITPLPWGSRDFRLACCALA